MPKMLWIMALGGMTVAQSEPIRAHPDNPHYYLFRGRPTVLVTSAEHYGAVMNRAFDYIAYLDALKSYGLNYTRIYPAGFVEPEGAFALENTLAPKPGDLIQPWARSQVPGYRSGGNRFDLDRWDVEYFRRLKDFLAQADARGIVVEVCFFNAQNKGSWPMSPLHWSNNIQNEERVDDYNEVQTLRHADLLRRQDAFVSRIVQEVNSFDNVILEICDEPFSYGTPRDLAGSWISHLVDLVNRTESRLPKRHLVGQQVQGAIGGPVDFSSHPSISLIVTQYMWLTPDEQVGGLKALDELYRRNKPIDLNETGYYPLDSWYEGDKAGDVRVEGWEFMVGGGSSFNNLNGMFTASDPAGRGGGNKPVLTSMQALKRFIDGFDFIKMRPDHTFVKSGIPDGAHYRGLSQPGEQYAFYHHHSTLKPYVYRVTPGEYAESLTLDLLAGIYDFAWVEPATGNVLDTKKIGHTGGTYSVSAPRHSVDIALRIKRQHGSGR
jgi:hypothetical protein